MTIHRRRQTISRKVLVIFGLSLATTALAAGTATIHINATNAGPRLNPRMYGIFLEEINHGVDGGLYAELIANRAFEDSRPPEGFTLQNGRYKDAKGYDAGFEAKPGVVPRWSLVREGGAQGAMRLETSGGLNENTPYCLRLEVDDITDGRIGMANEGFWGIGVKSGEQYDLTLHARGGSGFSGPLTIALEDAAGAPCSEAVKFDGIGADWKPFHARLAATKTEPKARLVITADAKGRVWLDFVSLFPRKTWKNHGLRPDIAEMIANLKPGFVRFPGGCVVEGGSIETAYNWKLTVGPVEQRPERWNAWNYHRTHGLGYFEYLQFCEDLGAEPMHVGFAGQTCLYRQAEHVPMAEMGWVITNFLEAIEYANGPAYSRWGALRANAGHPEPFNLKLVEIGNENATKEYEERYRLIHPVVKAKFPDVTYIADYAIPGATFDLVDDHFYNSPQWFLSQFGHYDRRDRSRAPVYVGEIAVTSNEGGRDKGNLIAALAEGVFLLGCERNADVVRMVSYAPLLAHVSGRSGWHGMIYHDSSRVCGTVSYHLWKLFGLNRPDFTVQTDVEFGPAKRPSIAGAIGVGTWDTGRFFAVAGRDEDGGDLIIKAINASAEPVATTVNLAGVSKLAAEARVTVLKSDRLEDNNSLDNPARVVPATSTRGNLGTKFRHEFPAYSLTVLRLKAR